ncbi:uncharacterized protein ISCGN_010228 [Ixodes scapularis]
MGNFLKTNDVDKSTGLSAQDKKNVRDTWNVFCKKHPHYGKLLFVAMFTRHPEFLQLFPHFRGRSLDALGDDPTFNAHSCAVGYQISAMVSTLENPGILTEMVRKNAVAHTVREGVQPPHFEALFGVAVQLLQKKLGMRMSSAAVQSWEKLIKDGREYRRNREHLRPTNEDLQSSDHFEEHLEDSPACALTSIQATPAALTPTVQHDDPAIPTTVATSTRTPTNSPAAVNSTARTEDDLASELRPCVARTSTRTVRRPQRLNYDQNFQQQA